MIEFVDERGDPLPGEFYAKVVDPDNGSIRFTTRSSTLDSIAVQTKT